MLDETAAASRTVCLNCGAPLAGAFCAACGQRAVDLHAPSLHVVWEGVSDAIDLDGRVMRTLRAIVVPGRLTLEFLRGRRAPYVGPLKLFLFAGAALSTTWVLTRGVDSRYYGIALDRSPGAYIDTVVRGSLAAGLAIAVASWALAGRRRRLLDEAVFALHVVAALSLLASVIIWLGTAWKVAWGSAEHVPSGVPSLVYVMMLPALAGGIAYIVGAVRSVHAGTWWATALRVVVVTSVGIVTVRLALSMRSLM